jgi:hypothetical protein
VVRKIQYLESNFNIFYDDVLLNDVKYEKLLGITIDNCLSWCQQINNIVSKISSRLKRWYIIFCIKNNSCFTLL